MKAFTKEDAKRDIYDRQIEAQRVKRAQLRGSREEGITIGLRATARKMKALGLPLETITAATGLASEEVAAL